MSEPIRSRGQAALEKLQVEIVRIKGIQKRFTLQVLGINALIYLGILLWMKGDVARTNSVFTNLFQYQAVAWCCWFMLPYFLRVEAKQDAGMAMAHDSVDLLSKVDEALEPRLARLDAIFDRIEKAVDQAEAGEHPLAKKLALDIQKAGDTIRDEVAELRKAFTKPIVAPPRKIVAPPMEDFAGVDSAKGNGS
jgi:hypothetical protein